MKKLASLLLFAVVLVSLTSFSSSQQQPAAAPHIYITVDNQTDIEQGSMYFASTLERKDIIGVLPYTIRTGTLSYISSNNQIDIYAFAETNGLPITIYYDWYIGNTTTPTYSYSYTQWENISLTIPQQTSYQSIRCVIHY